MLESMCNHTSTLECDAIDLSVVMTECLPMFFCNGIVPSKNRNLGIITKDDLETVIVFRLLEISSYYMFFID